MEMEVAPQNVSERRKPLPYFIGLAVVLLNVAILAAGLFTPHWSSTDHIGPGHEGLWSGCYKDECHVIFDYAPLPSTTVEIFVCYNCNRV
jgi:hypothetical protein